MKERSGQRLCGGAVIRVHLPQGDFKKVMHAVPEDMRKLVSLSTLPTARQTTHAGA